MIDGDFFDLDIFCNDGTFLIEREHPLSKELMRKASEHDDTCSVDFIKKVIKDRNEEIYSLFENKIGNKIPVFDILGIITPRTIFESKITHHVKNVNSLNEKNISPLIKSFGQKIIREYRKHLIPVMTTINYDTTFSFHDAWHCVNYDINSIISIIRDYALVSFSTVEYVHSRKTEYINTKKLTDQFYKVCELASRNQPIQAVNLIDAGMIIDNKSSLIYLPSNYNLKFFTYKLYRNAFGKIKYPKLKSKDIYRDHYNDQKIVDRSTGESYYQCYLVDCIKNLDLQELLELLMNYFHVILFNSKTIGPNGETFHHDYFNFCKHHHDKIREGILEGKSKELINEYFPTFSVREIADEIGFWEIDYEKVKLKLNGQQAIDGYKQAKNYFECSQDVYIEYTLFTFLAFQHRNNGGSTVGYPHIHITYLIEARDRLSMNKIHEYIDNEIREKTGLRDILTKIREDNSYEKSIAYVIKNARVEYVDKMLTQLNHYNNRIRNQGDPYVLVDFFDKQLFELTQYDILTIAGCIDGINPNVTSQRSSHIPMKIRYNKSDIEIYKDIVEKFYPDKLDALLTSLEDIDQNIFDINFIPPIYKEIKNTWIRYIQFYMVEHKLIVCDEFIYQKITESKYSFKEYKSIKEFIEGFSFSISPPPPSRQLKEELVELLTNQKPEKIEGSFNFPCVKINFRIVEYKDFILDIVNRCTYSKPPNGQYCYIFFNDVNLGNIIPRVSELISHASYTVQDYNMGRLKRNIVGLLSHLGNFDIQFLSLMHATINVRFDKEGLIILIGDSSSYKSKLILLPIALFPFHKIGRIRECSSFELESQVRTQNVIIVEEANKFLENLNREARGPILQLASGETITVQKKFGDHSNIPTENKSFITLANIDENTRNYITKPEFVNRLRIRNTKYNDVDFGVVTLSEYLCCLPEFLYLVTMSSLSEEYYNCEKLPILKHFDKIPEPLERVHKYFLYDCNPKYLIKEGEPTRSALDIRDSIYELRTDNTFLDFDPKLLKTSRIDKSDIIRKISSESEQIHIKKLSHQKLQNRQIDEQVRIEVASRMNQGNNFNYGQQIVSDGGYSF